MGKIKTKHLTKQLKTIIGTDLLSAREKFVMGTVGGFYSLANEQAYFKAAGDKSQMSVPEFERYLKEKIHRNFIVVYNSVITPENQCVGHSIYFSVPVWDAFIPVCKVGRSADRIIPANSQGKIALYKGSRYKEVGIFDEEPILWRGWVAAFEACRLAYHSWESEGIEPSRAISAKEAMAMKQAYTVIAGGNSAIKDAVAKMTETKLLDELANNTTNIELLKKSETHKFINKTDPNSNMFMDNAEYDALSEEKKKTLHEGWEELNEEQVLLKIKSFEEDKKEIQEDISEDETTGEIDA